MVRYIHVNDKGAVSTGSLDHAENWPPNKHMGVESQIPIFNWACTAVRAS